MDYNRVNRIIGDQFRATVSWIWSFLKHYIGGLYNRVGDHHIFLLGGGMSFSMIMCMLPLVLITFAVIGMVLERQSVSSEVTNFIHRAIPYPEYADWLSKQIMDRVTEFRAYKGAAGLVGLIGLLIASSSLFASMRIVLNRVYNVESDQSIYLAKLRDVGLVLGVVVYFLLSTTILPSLSVVENMASKVDAISFLDLATMAEIGVQALSFLIIFLAFFALYYLVPQKSMSKRAVMISAIWASVLWKIAEQAFEYYITSVASLKRIYGAYSLFVVIALWIYYTSLVFIIAAEIGQLYNERRKQRKEGVSVAE